MTIDRLHRQLSRAMTEHLTSGLPARVPDAGRLFWQWFGDLHEARTWHASGPNPISFSEIAAWMLLNAQPLQPHHVALIRTIDKAWVDHFYSKRNGDTSNVKRLPQLSKHAVTPEMFDAMFG